MITSRGISIDQQSSYLYTDGLKNFIGREIKLLIKEQSIDNYYDVLRYLISYSIDSRPDINPDQTISYHSWILKFVLESDSFYNLWEASYDGANFVEGVDYSIQVVTEQEKVCKDFFALASFPTFNQMVVISQGIYEGLSVEAVRYPSPNHMTGWWLTTERYDGNIKSLMTVHYYHLAFKRPDLLKYLALPFGFRFFAGKELDIWLDNKVLLTEN